MKILTIHDAKGKKDRTVPIPDALMGALKAQLNRVIEQHERDCRTEYDGVFLPGQLEKKYKNAARELTWQWFFPAKELTVVPGRKERKYFRVRVKLNFESLNSTHPSNFHKKQTAGTPMSTSYPLVEVRLIVRLDKTSFA